MTGCIHGCVRWTASRWKCGIVILLLWVMMSGLTSWSRRRTSNNDTQDHIDTIQINQNEESNIWISKSSSRFYPPRIATGPVGCFELFKGNKKSLTLAENYQKSNTKLLIPNESYTSMAQNCSSFIQNRGYITDPLTEEEANFPIAYSIMTYHDVEQTERLLRAIYRPQNYYCIHVDGNAPWRMKEAFRAIVNCFPNVFLSSRFVSVVWAEWTVVEAELVCMNDLLKYPKWSYHMNLAAQEFPLKTNLELVRILKAFNGSNLIEGSADRMDLYKRRYLQRYKGMTKLEGRNEKPPIDVEMNKGSFLIVATRGFVDFVLHNKSSQTFGEWLVETRIPDEFFFSTINHNPKLGAPGAYRGSPSSGPLYPFFNRFIIWEFDDRVCDGKYVRRVCIMSVWDLQKLYKIPQLFVNKFHLDYDPLAYTCMEEFIFNRTRAEINGKRDFDTQYYSKYEFTWNHN